jgi:FkbM family methyltransferase
MKSKIMAFLQRIIGLENYYFIFACFKIYTLAFDSRKRTYNYFVKLLEPHFNVMVAGGFIGITTIPIAKRCKSGKTLVFEPVKLNFNVLKRVAKYFKTQNTVVTNAALGFEEKELKIKTPILNGAVYNGMSHLEHLDYLDTNQYIEDTTQIYNGDNFFESQNIPIHAIKLVAENYEFEIYKGLLRTITKFQPLIYTELWDKVNRDKIFNFFESVQYAIFILDDQNKLTPFKSEIHDTKFFVLKPSNQL